MMRLSLQKFAIWILKKTKYQFKIEHDEFKIEVNEVGIEMPTRYDFVCQNKEIGIMNYIEMTRYFHIEDMFDCPNPKTKGVRFNDESKVKNLEKQYNNLIKAVKKSAKVVT